MSRPSPEEIASFRFGGKRARPRKGIEGTVVSGQTYLKPPGSCGTRWPGLGITVEVDCCKDCSIYILDPCEQVQISECVDCRVVVGPCVGSLLFFDCSGCTVTSAAKQTRLRDVSNCTLRVFAPTKDSVVIETSKNLRFGGWDVAYPGLAAQFAHAKWAPNASNFCDAIFDFSPPVGGGRNWSPVGVDTAGRWCELAITAEGLTGGTVTESRVQMPTLQGCECPCAAPDGTVFEAPWYSSSAASTKAVEAEAAETAAKAAAPATSTSAAAPSAAHVASGGLFSRAIGWLGSWMRRGSKAPEPPAVSTSDIQIQGAGKQTTAVCIVS